MNKSIPNPPPAKYKPGHLPQYVTNPPTSCLPVSVKTVERCVALYFSPLGFKIIVSEKRNGDAYVSNKKAYKGRNRILRLAAARGPVMPGRAPGHGISVVPGLQDAFAALLPDDSCGRLPFPRGVHPARRSADTKGGQREDPLCGNGTAVLLPEHGNNQRRDAAHLCTLYHPCIQARRPGGADTQACGAGDHSRKPGQHGYAHREPAESLSIFRLRHERRRLCRICPADSRALRCLCCSPH